MLYKDQQNINDWFENLSYPTNAEKMISLEKRFRDYYKKLHHVERRFLIIFIIDMTLYSIILLTYLIVSGVFEYNNTNLSFLLFSLFSGLVTDCKIL